MRERQSELWRRRWSELDGTAVARQRGLSPEASYDDYLGGVAAAPYEFYEPFIDRLEAGEENVLFPGKPVRVGLTSGTTGMHGKRIPYNDASLAVFRSFQLACTMEVARGTPSLELDSMGILGVAGQETVHDRNGVPYGYISGILQMSLSQARPGQAFPKIAPGSHPDWDERLDLICRQTLTADIQMITGVPGFLVAVLKEVKRRAGVSALEAIWPKLKVCVYGGTGIAAHREEIDALVGRPLDYYGNYVSTEAPLGVPVGPTNGMQVYRLHDDVLYSLSPVEEPDRLLCPSEAKAGHVYLLHVGMPNGFLHYPMRDEIRILRAGAEMTFEVLGRSGNGLNVASEKISDRQLADAVAELERRHGMAIAHYVAYPSRIGGKPRYGWLLFVDKPPVGVDAARLAATLDRTLKLNHADYREFRERVIAAPEVTVYERRHLDAYLEDNRNRGQFKMRHVFRSMEEYAAFRSRYLDGRPVIAAFDSAEVPHE